MRCILVALLGLTVGCAHTQPTVHGIPNFGVIYRGNSGPVYFGGEPSEEGNAYLKDVLHVTRRVDLNTGSPAKGTEKQFELIRVPISLGEQIFGYGLDNKVPLAVSLIKPYTFVNCQHGKNRTQTVMGCYQLSDGDPEEFVMREMVSHGWSDSLPGLKWWYFKHLHEIRPNESYSTSHR